MTLRGIGVALELAGARSALLSASLEKERSHDLRRGRFGAEPSPTDPGRARCPTSDATALHGFGRAVPGMDPTSVRLRS
jgi:hypothetical protein